MTRSLNCSRFVHVDMSRFNAYHTVVPSGDKVYHRGIGLCAAYKKYNVATAVFKTAGLENKLFGALRILVAPVTGSLFHICLNETGKHFGMTTPHIITVEM